MTPIIAATELEKLPPVTVDHVDVTPFLKDKSSIANIKETYAKIEQINDLRTKIHNLKYSLLVNIADDNANTLARGANCLTLWHTTFFGRNCRGLMYRGS